MWVSMLVWGSVHIANDPHDPSLHAFVLSVSSIEGKFKVDWLWNFRDRVDTIWLEGMQDGTSQASDFE